MKLCLIEVNIIGKNNAWSSIPPKAHPQSQLLYSINPGNLMTETRKQCYQRLGEGSAYNKTNIRLKETKY